MTRAAIGVARLGWLAIISANGPAGLLAFTSLGPFEPAIAGRLAPSGDRFAFIAGDSISVVTIASGAHENLIGGVAIEAGFVRKQLVWAPNSRLLLFRRGAPPFANYAVVDATSGRSTEVFPDSLRGKLRTFGNAYTAPPVWSPDSRRVAFLAGRPGERGAVTAIWLAEIATDPADPRRMYVAWSSGPEKTAIAWARAGLAWASRAPSGEASIFVGQPGRDTVEHVSTLSIGAARITDLYWGPGDTLILAATQTGSPYLIDVRGTPQKRESSLPALAYVGWLSETELLAFRAPTRMTSELVAVRVSDGQVRVLASEEGLLSDATIAHAGQSPRIALSRESGSQPRLYVSGVVGRTGELRGVSPVLPSAFVLPPDPWSSRVISWTAADGKLLEAQLLRPLDGSTRRGTIVVPYGGYRNSALSSTYFLDVMLRQLLIDGWQVIRPNTRGVASTAQTAGYGAVQLMDTHRLLDVLRAESLAGPDRIAVIGHSHGAAMAYYYATHSGRFCAVVAINGRADWVMQAQYDADGLLPGPMGTTPQKDPALYRAASPVANARAVRVPMLLVGGQKDMQLLVANVTTMADSLGAHGKAFESIIFSDEGHQIDLPLNRARLLDATRRTLRKGCGV